MNEYCIIYIHVSSYVPRLTMYYFGTVSIHLCIFPWIHQQLYSPINFGRAFFNFLTWKVTFLNIAFWNSKNNILKIFPKMQIHHLLDKSYNMIDIRRIVFNYSSIWIPLISDCLKNLCFFVNKYRFIFLITNIIRNSPRSSYSLGRIVLCKKFRFSNRVLGGPRANLNGSPLFLFASCTLRKSALVGD